MKNQLETSLRIRLAGMAILALFIALAAAAFLSGEQVKRSSELIVTDAVPGTINAHKMRMAMSRSIGWVMVAASAQTTQSRMTVLKSRMTPMWNSPMTWRNTRQRLKLTPRKTRRCSKR